MVIIAILTAVEVLLARVFGFYLTSSLRVSFDMAVVALAAWYYGPVAGAAVGGLGDLIGSLVFPAGPYFPGFTLSAVLTGLIFGLFLYSTDCRTRQTKSVIALIICSVLITQIVCVLLLDTLWINLLYGAPFIPTLMIRLLKVAILTPCETVMLIALYKSKTLNKAFGIR